MNKIYSVAVVWLGLLILMFLDGNRTLIRLFPLITFAAIILGTWISIKTFSKSNNEENKEENSNEK